MRSAPRTSCRRCAPIRRCRRRRAPTPRSSASSTRCRTRPTARPRRNGCAKAGYRYCQVGENLASIFDTRGFDRRRLRPARGAGLGGIPRAPQEHDAAVRHRDRRRGGALPRRPSRSTSPCSCSGARTRRSTPSRSPTCRAARSPTRSRKRPTPSRRREVITHTACLPGTIEFDTGNKTGAVSRYETRAGQVFTVRPGVAGAVTVEVKQAPSPAK